MSRVTECWFEYGGINCETKGLSLMELPTRETAARNGQRVEVPGRSGYVWIPEDSYSEIGITCECRTLDNADRNAIADWLLRGDEDWLRFSDEPAVAYKAQVLQKVARSSLLVAHHYQRYPVVFVCQPYRYLWPQRAAITASSGGTVANQGTYISAPKIEITASGEGRVVIGSCIIGLTDGGCVIDSELGLVFDADNITLKTNSVSLTGGQLPNGFPGLLPGNNTITWSGGVTGVTITPRDRSL